MSTSGTADSGNDVPRWRLRPGTADDREWAFALHAESLGEYIASTWGWDSAVQRRWFDHEFDVRSQQVIEVDGEPAGVLWAEERADEVYLALIEIARPWRGRGLGHAIVRSMLDRAEELGRPLNLQVLRANTRGKEFYERCGLRVVDSDDVRFRMSNR